MEVSLNQLSSLSSVIVGALIAGVASLVVASFQARQTVIQNNREAMRRSFSEVLDALYDTRESLCALGNSQGGRQSEFAATTDEEVQESRDRDAMGVASINRMDEALERANRAAVHMGAYASESTLLAYHTLKDDLFKDLQAMMANAMETHLFVAAHFNTLLDNFDTNLKKTSHPQ